MQNISKKGVDNKERIHLFSTPFNLLYFFFERQGCFCMETLP